MDVRLRDVPEQRVVTEQATVDQAALGGWLPGAMSRVHETAGAARAETGEQPWLLRDHVAGEPVFIVIYEGNPNEGPVLVEVCTPLRPQAADPDGASARTIPAHREAYVRLPKNIVTSGRIGEAYAAVEHWAGEQNLQVAAAPRETYWTDFMAAGPDDEVFDVAFPVR
ncbi:MAG TPA: GyrI-like domain-containing protein [Streptosporangiaceae bacterium]